mmetsp:Transcript_63377/g.137879  ORF Transcript_63377/g.137879 Transcript_63377/m.137879 type:complete len:83 (-) Transcript_63377:56-304(-)
MQRDAKITNDPSVVERNVELVNTPENTGNILLPGHVTEMKGGGCGFEGLQKFQSLSSILYVGRDDGFGAFTSKSDARSLTNP